MQYLHIVMGYGVCFTQLKRIRLKFKCYLETYFIGELSVLETTTASTDL